MRFWKKDFGKRAAGQGMWRKVLPENHLVIQKERGGPRWHTKQTSEVVRQAFDGQKPPKPTDMLSTAARAGELAGLGGANERPWS